MIDYAKVIDFSNVKLKIVGLSILNGAIIKLFRHFGKF